MHDGNPQKENGKLDIANELVEQFCKHNITGQEWRIIWTIFRKTWCWKDGDRRKDEDWISISQFEKSTGMKRGNIHGCIKSLLAKKLITVSQKANGNLFYGFNKHYKEWLLVKRLTHPAVSQKAPRVLVKRLNTKETITKENIYTCMGEKDFDQFWEHYPVHKSKAEALKKFLKLPRKLLPQILLAIENEKKEKQRLKAEKKFCPEWKLPATWINKKCWEDEMSIHQTQTLKESIIF